MISFFLRQLFRILRLFLVVLPITGIVYSFSFIALTIEIIAGDNVLSSMLPIQLESTSVKTVMLKTLSGYLSLLSQYSGTLMYLFLFLFMLILVIPLSFVFIAAGNFVYAGKYFIYLCIADAILYLILFIFFKRTPLAVIKARYRKYFPSVGRRINRRSYDRWLERHHDEFENDTFGQPKRSRIDDFYREDYYEHSDDEYEDEYEDEYDNEYLEDQYYYSEDDYPEEVYDSDNDYYDDSDDLADNRSAFNFFAGCTTLESANKKYKSLVKLYHPDNMDGDTSALQEINVQYNEIKKRLG